MTRRIPPGGARPRYRSRHGQHRLRRRGAGGGRLVALDGGVIETPPDLPPERRLAAIHARVAELIAEHEPDAVALEELYFGANARSAFAVGQARGVVMLAAGQARLPCAGYTPQQVKSAVCGSGRADKGQVARMVQALLSLPELPTPDHASDALGVAICHVNRHRWRRVLGRRIRIRHVPALAAAIAAAGARSDDRLDRRRGRRQAQRPRRRRDRAAASATASASRLRRCARCRPPAAASRC